MGLSPPDPKSGASGRFRHFRTGFAETRIQRFVESIHPHGARVGMRYWMVGNGSVPLDSTAAGWAIRNVRQDPRTFRA